MAMRPFWTCSETSRRLAEGEHLGWFGLLHLLYCRHCRKFMRQVRLLGALARRRAASFVLPDVAALQARVLRDLRG